MLKTSYAAQRYAIHFHSQFLGTLRAAEKITAGQLLVGGAVPDTSMGAQAGYFFVLGLPRLLRRAVRGRRERRHEVVISQAIWGAALNACRISAQGRRQITDHVGAGITRDDSAGIARKRDARKIGTGIDQSQNGRPRIL